MLKVIEKIVYEYASTMSLLIVDDDKFALSEYATLFENFFRNVDTAIDGQDAYEKWNTGNKKYDLIITDLLMPSMDGFELISKIRLKSPSQHIIVLTAIKNINELKSILSMGIDGILEKPYNHSNMILVLSRVLKVIYNNNLIRRQAFQLKLFAKANIKSKVNLKEIKSATSQLPPKKITPPVHKTRPILKETTENAEEFTANLDYLDIDRVEVFQDKIESYQNIACEIANSNPSEAKEGLTQITMGLRELIDVLNQLGTFGITVGATTKLIDFLEELEEEKFEDTDKKDLFIDGLMAVLEDLFNWIDMVFVQKNTDDINYFDASFANTCLELESIFADTPLQEDDDSLDFF